MNSFHILKNQSKRVIDFFLGDKSKEDKEDREDNLIGTMVDSMTDRDEFISEQEKLIEEGNEDCSSCEGAYPYLDKLFGFVSDRKENEPINITAAHYFSEIVISLLAEQPRKIRQYVFANESALDFIIRNVESRCFKTLLAKILNTERDESSSHSDLLFFRQRLIWYGRLMDRMGEVEGGSVDGICEVFVDLVKEEENVAESGYFIEKLLTEPERFRVLFALLKTKKSQKLFELTGLIIRRVFLSKEEEESEREREPNQPTLRHTDRRKFKVKVKDRNNRTDGEDSPEFLPVEQENEQENENDNEVNDSRDMLRMDLAQVIEQELPSLVMTLTDSHSHRLLFQDGLSFGLGSSRTKVSVLGLMKEASEIEFDIVRDILADRTAIRLVLAG